jgi:hypothetical protein
MRLPSPALLVVLSVGLLPPSAAQAQDPVQYCKENPKELKCLEFLGGSAGFHSQSGNVAAQSVAPKRDAARYVVFLHSGGSGPPAVADEVAKALRARGYVVRGVDDKLDAAGGPGVDYFSDQDRPGAAEVADIVNAALPRDRKRLAPRFQKVSNPSGFLGVWLYEK